MSDSQFAQPNVKSRNYGKNTPRLARLIPTARELRETAFHEENVYDYL